MSKKSIIERDKTARYTSKLNQIYGKNDEQKEEEMIFWGHAPSANSIPYEERICGENCDCKTGEDCYGDAALNLIKKLENK